MTAVLNQGQNPRLWIPAQAGQVIAELIGDNDPPPIWGYDEVVGRYPAAIKCSDRNPICFQDGNLRLSAT